MLSKFVDSTLAEQTTQTHFDSPGQLVTKRIGSPDRIENGVQVYNTRSEFPFDKFLSEGTEKIEMLAITFHNVTTNHIRTIEQLIFGGITFIFYILHPLSKYVEMRASDFHEGAELGHHIERSLVNLCELKRKLPKTLKNKLILATSDDLISESI